MKDDITMCECCGKNEATFEDDNLGLVCDDCALNAEAEARRGNIYDDAERYCNSQGLFSSNVD